MNLDRHCIFMTLILETLVFVSLSRQIGKATTLASAVFARGIRTV